MLDSSIPPPVGQIVNQPGIQLNTYSDLGVNSKLGVKFTPSQAAVAKTAGLGTTCQITVPPPCLDSENGFAKSLSPLVKRFMGQASARSLLPAEKVSKCLRLPVPGSSSVDLLHAPLVQKAHYRNLMVCSSVWHCPVCAAKITERRRVELQAGLDVWRDTWEGQTLLMTFTVQHSQAETCSFVLEGLLNAHSAFWSGAPAIRFRSRYGIVGKIRSLEVTYGQNGWHAHIHVLLFIKADNLLFLGDMRAAAAERWRSVLARYDRFASVAHGLDIRGADDLAGDYLAKMGLAPASADGWTSAHELAKSHVKSGRLGSLTPNDLLLAYAYGDGAAGRLWQEYATAFKGKRQLVWSDGLRILLRSEPEKSDEEIAAEQEQIAVVLAQLELEQWRMVVGNDIRAELLEVAAPGDQQAVKNFLEEFGIFGVFYPALTVRDNSPTAELYEA